MGPLELNLILPCGSHDLGTGFRNSLRGGELNSWNNLVLGYDLWLSKLRSEVYESSDLKLELDWIDQNNWVRFK